MKYFNTKKADIGDIIEKGNSLMSDSWLGSTAMNLDFGTQILRGAGGITKHPDTGKWYVKDHVSNPITGKKLWNSPQVSHKIVNGIKKWHSNLNPASQLLLKKTTGVVKKGLALQNGLFFADLGMGALGLKRTPEQAMKIKQERALSSFRNEIKPVSPIGSKTYTGLLKNASSDWYQTHLQEAKIQRMKYYQMNRALLAKKAKLYRKKVMTHQKVQKRRMHVGHSYVPVGQKAASIREILLGGKGDNKRDSLFNPKALKKGMSHEAEHTKNKRIQKEIAKDHLVEDKSYYTKLEKMEDKKASYRYGDTALSILINNFRGDR